MISKAIACAVYSAAVFVSSNAMAAGCDAQPTSVIYDTDMYGDIDDVLALAMLHTLEDRCETKLLAVTSSTDEPSTVSYIDALNTWYGRGDIPIGIVQNGVDGEATAAQFPRIRNHVVFPKHISAALGKDGRLAYPHDLVGGSKVPTAVNLLRKTLAGQPDGSVVTILVGFSTNFAALLDSKPDAVSPLTGMELVAKKVRFLSVMAGNFADRTGKLRQDPQREFNIMFDVPAAQKLFARWPTPIMVSDFDIGKSMLLRGKDVETKFAYAKDNPVAATYRHADPIYRSEKTPAGALHDHATYDLTSVLYAARPDDGYFSLSEPGTVVVDEKGITMFHPTPEGKHRYFIMTSDQRARALEAMTSLVTQPPLGRPR